MTDSRPFALTVCQPGMERWLKAEMEVLRPDLRPAYARPGALTFKCTEAPFAADVRVKSFFGRIGSSSLGLADDAPAVWRLSAEVGARHLFLGHRDAGPPAEVAPARQAEFAADEAR